jgi:hypothetical protein
MVIASRGLLLSSLIVSPCKCAPRSESCFALSEESRPPARPTREGRHRPERSQRGGLDHARRQHRSPDRNPSGQYLDNVIEQDRRAIERLVRPMRGFQSFPSARVTLHGIELAHVLEKGQMVDPRGSVAEQFYSLAA